MISIVTDTVNSTASKQPLTAKLQGCKPVGGIFRLDYDTAIALTDDFKKLAAGGVPRGVFLLAAAGKNSDNGFILFDQELILLRVTGTAPLPNEAELVQTRLAVVRDADILKVGFDDVTDVLTRNELQQSAFDCEVLGTFYTETDERSSDIKFGADIDNVMVSARYQVFLPSTEILSWLASYPEPADPKDALAIGVVRFSATRRKSLLAGTDQAQVRIHVGDFIGRKTAVLGMTRVGKSNSIKTLTTSVHRYGSEHGQKIGQLIFDPQGEYAHTNEQDNTGLALLGDDESTVRVYLTRPDPTDPRHKPLRINFLDPTNLDLVWSLVMDQIAQGNSAKAQYLKGIQTISIEAPDPSDFSAVNRYGRKLLALYALLDKAGIRGNLPGPAGHGLKIVMTKDAAPIALTAVHSLNAGPRVNEVIVTSSATAAALLDWIKDHQEDPSSTTGVGILQSWVDDTEFQDMSKAIYGGSGGISAVKGVRDFHDGNSTGNVMEQIWQDMIAGRLVIVDLSSGNDRVAKAMSERIVTHLLNEARDRFRDGHKAIQMQIIVEEAHNLFERGDRQVTDDPWVRLSKEAAKYKIGLVYATQEVTSVDKRILSNTSNWLIGHLNSDVETKELSHYYDFRVFAPSLVRVEEVGFVRMKTYSGKYIVPVQIAKFDHAMINAARVAAGLPEIIASDGV